MDIALSKIQQKNYRRPIRIPFCFSAPFATPQSPQGSAKKWKTPIQVENRSFGFRRVVLAVFRTLSTRDETPGRLYLIS